MSNADLKSQMLAHLEYFKEMGIDVVETSLTTVAPSASKAVSKPVEQKEVAQNPNPQSPPKLQQESKEEKMTDKSQAQLLDELWRDEIEGCTKCPLAETGRQNIVFGDGSASSDIMFVGEGPGRDEDIQGLPFVGRAGQKLNDIIRAMGYDRSDVYIANIVKCRPPGNRNPEPVEVETCTPYLQKQMEIIKPKVIVTLGAVSTHTLLKIDTPISKLRGNFQEYMGIPVMPTFHPAYLLRNYTPETRKKVWDDMLKVMTYLESN